MERERPPWCPNSKVAFVMFIDRVISVEEAFHRTDWEGYFDPVPCRVVLQPMSLDTMIEKPVVNEVQSIVGRLDQLIDFGCT